MRLDVNALGTFHEMAHEGAKTAASRLTKMTNVQAHVDVTKVNFMSAEDIRAEFNEGGHFGVQVKLAGGPGGQSIIVFDEASAQRVLQTLLPDRGSPEPGEFSDMDRSAMTELGHIMNNGFIDGWANVLETAIDISTPEFVAGDTAEAVLGDIEAAMGDAELALMFQSHIDAVGEEIAFRHYLFPDYDAMGDTLAKVSPSRTRGFEYEKLTGFDRMIDQGADEVARSVTQMTGFDTTVEIRHINFIPVETIPRDVSDKRQVGVAFTFDGLPSGYLVFLFDESSAREIVDALLPTTPDNEFGEMGESAIKELGNIMASGFLDGWANVLDTAIDMSTPNYIRDMGSALVDPIAIEIGQSQEYAFVFDTMIQALEREFDCAIMAIPEEGTLERALDALDIEQIGVEQEAPSFPIDEA